MEEPQHIQSQVWWRLSPPAFLERPACGRIVGNSETDSHSREIAICACRLPRGILCAEDSFRRMPLRARSLFFALVVLGASSGSLARAQAPATTKKPNPS